MKFLDAFDESARERLLGHAEHQHFTADSWLAAAGQSGGMLFLVREGAVDLVDSRRHPEVITAQYGPGSLVGATDFFDDKQRETGLRASVDTEVLVWKRPMLVQKLEADTELAAKLYRFIAQYSAADRRSVARRNPRPTQQDDSVRAEDLERARLKGRSVAASIAEELIRTESVLRRDRDSASATRNIRLALDELEAKLDELVTTFPIDTIAKAGRSEISQALRPWLVRSTLAEQCLRRPQGQVITDEVMSHVEAATESGDGLIGRVLDRWLLDRSTLSAFRILSGGLLTRAIDAWPARATRRILLVGAGTGSLAVDLLKTLADPGGTLTVIDERPEALDRIEKGRGRAPKVNLVTQVVDLAAFATGRYLPDLSRYDVIIVQGMIEFMPDRLVVGFSRALLYFLTPGGTLLLGALAPSRDAAIMDTLLDWPTTRRSPDELSRLVASSGLSVTDANTIRGPALILGATPPP